MGKTKTKDEGIDTITVTGAGRSVTLTPEEFDRAAEATPEEIEAALEEARKEQEPPSEREKWQLVLAQLNQRDIELTEDWNKAQDKKLKAMDDMDSLAFKRRANTAALGYVQEKLASLPVEDGLALWDEAKKGATDGKESDGNGGGPQGPPD